MSNDNSYSEALVARFKRVQEGAEWGWQADVARRLGIAPKDFTKYLNLKRGWSYDQGLRFENLINEEENRQNGSEEDHYKYQVWDQVQHTYAQILEQKPEFEGELAEFLAISKLKLSEIFEDPENRKFGVGIAIAQRILEESREVF